MRVMAKIIGVKHIKRVISKQRNFSFLQVGNGVDSCSPPPNLLSSPSLESRFLEPLTHSERLKQAIYHKQIISN